MQTILKSATLTKAPVSAKGTITQALSRSHSRLIVLRSGEVSWYKPKTETPLGTLSLTEATVERRGDTLVIATGPLKLVLSGFAAAAEEIDAWEVAIRSQVEPGRGVAARALAGIRAAEPLTLFYWPGLGVSGRAYARGGCAV